MQLTQTKLTKKEWEGIEIPSTPQEKRIINLIQSGYNDIHYSENNGQTILNITKISFNSEVEKYLYVLHFKNALDKFYNKHKMEPVVVIENSFKPKKRDSIRIKNSEKIIMDNKKIIAEFVIIEALERFSKLYLRDQLEWQKWFYTLISLHKTVEQCNSCLKTDIAHIIGHFTEKCDFRYIIENAQEIIEHNEVCENFKKLELYQHQKRLFQHFKGSNQTPAKLMFYVAPTGTGKTMSPLGLAGKYRVIFVCAARHIGMALAKHSISGKRKIALAFGCDDASQIRLHYSAAKEFTRNYKTGGIYKVDNSVGDNVEIMISDIKSYLVAMRYMMAFNEPKDMILYWDEPTISMDYSDHEFHSIIKDNWNENKIPNIVLSSATLPKMNEINDTIASYKAQFGGECHEIISNHSKNSVSILSKDNYVVLPHNIFDDYDNMIKCVDHCKEQSSLLRYMDLHEITQFLLYLENNRETYLKARTPSLGSYFDDISQITMNSIKEYYLDCFRFIKREKWSELYTQFKEKQTKLFDSSVYLTTKDAHTITNGPCIYLANDVGKVAKFLYQQSKITEYVVNQINRTIEENSKHTDAIMRHEKALEDMLANEDPDKDIEDDKYKNTAPRKLMNEIEKLNRLLKPITLPEEYIPNNKVHYKKHVDSSISLVDCSDVRGLKNSFKSGIENIDIMKIMRIANVENYWKTLALMGIGCFQSNPDISYLETVKELIEAQKMMLVIASSDYIYGTNYQFSHGYIGKDQSGITQEKLIQAMGRVGRKSSSHRYTVRFRDDALINRIFTKLDMKQEAETMNRLFS